jgi:thiamine-phosphate pyrophosphorylase
MRRAVDAAIYLITDGNTYPQERLEQALLAVPMGRLAVQLRNRALEGAALFRLTERLRTITALFSAPLFVNDRLDVALAVGADGVHLPGHGLFPRDVRALVQERLLICAAFGPIWPTPSKPAESGLFPVGTAALAEVAAALPVPVFALGGIDTPERAAACAEAGARIACLRAILGDADPGAAAAVFLDAIKPAA